MKNNLKYVVIGFLLLAGCAAMTVGHTNKKMTLPKNESEFAKTAVMITSDNMRSGGTGVILESTPTKTKILTNKHICNLIQIGGKVVTDDGKIYPVASYRVYKRHDLCLITVVKDLHINTRVAQKAPDVYSTSIVVGHPALLPTIVTVGHFSQWREIQLMVGEEPCDGSEGPDEATMCVFMGGKPILRSFQGQSTSATIMPGSSGSAVYNSNGELSGLIFAGQEGLSYGFLVPWEYVHDFLKHINHYKEEVPAPTKDPKNFFIEYAKVEAFCKETFISQNNGICKSMTNLGIVINE